MNYSNPHQQELVKACSETVFLSKPHPVKVTALHYIREAVRKSRFEELNEMIGIAGDFGADTREIHEALGGIGRV